jgi:hypothetical protein
MQEDGDGDNDDFDEEGEEEGEFYGDGSYGEEDSEGNSNLLLNNQFIS